MNTSARRRSPQQFLHPGRESTAGLGRGRAARPRSSVQAASQQAGRAWPELSEAQQDLPGDWRAAGLASPCSRGGPSPPRPLPSRCSVVTMPWSAPRSALCPDLSSSLSFITTLFLRHLTAVAWPPPRPRARSLFRQAFVKLGTAKAQAPRGEPASSPSRPTCWAAPPSCLLSGPDSAFARPLPPSECPPRGHPVSASPFLKLSSRGEAWRLRSRASLGPPLLPR